MLLLDRRVPDYSGAAHDLDRLVYDLAGNEELDCQTLEDIVRVVDQARAELFFAMPLLPLLPYEVLFVSVDGCAVIMVTRTSASVDRFYDPSGELSRGYAQPVELEARIDASGGSFAWEITTDNDYHTRGPRAFFRPLRYETTEVRVTFNSDLGGTCEDVLYVNVEGGYPVGY